VPALERARELFLSGMRPEAMAEWQFGSETLPAEARTQSIRLAAEWGWYDQAVTVATAQHVFNDYTLLYPRPYDAEVNAAAHLAQLAPEIVYGVVRQESRGLDRGRPRPDAVTTGHGAQHSPFLQASRTRIDRPL
jgi:soluble lytic murein transglycosylase